MSSPISNPRPGDPPGDADGHDAPRTPFPLDRRLALRSRGDQIADQLVTAIALGEYVEGQRLPPERELASLVGVSRQSVRDAIHQLADAGYVEIRRGRSGGTFVTASWRPESQDRVRRTLAPRWDEFEDLFELRQTVEAMIARKAAARHHEADAARLLAAAGAIGTRRIARHHASLIRRSTRPSPTRRTVPRSKPSQVRSAAR